MPGVAPWTPPKITIMIYSDNELKTWWQKLSEYEKTQLLDLMVEQTSESEFSISIRDQYLRGKTFSPKQLQAIKKWDR